jgi:hypothetical protein
MSNWYITPKEDDLMHYGVKGMKWRFKKPSITKTINSFVEKNKNVDTERTVQRMVTGKKKLDKRYIMDNWDKIKKNPKLILLLKTKYPMFYKQLTTRLHSGGGGGRF